MSPNLTLTSLPVGVLVILGVLALAELALDVFALVDLVRRPRERVALGNKWVWVAIIVLINLIGAILYLTIGRRPATPVEQVPSAPGTVSNRSVADALYGDPADEGGSGKGGTGEPGTGGSR
ncbi:PLD nuclease N-terminal domain-containing protein [Leifsonia poae]|uniref:PLD nuclease N-terminal domain-containing protein n=1 Tax=Leifsonia poae TaxID=110933 RepID=UPI001CBBD66D|nr:PLD nuclease N-terminal domain-containing protein [Leifsonia poae]